MLRLKMTLLGILSTMATLRADDGVVAFETIIRPLLVEHCVSCHGEKKQSAGMRLDTVKGITTGSDEGSVIVPGKPNESKLIKSVRHDGDVQMPPKKKLPDEAISALTKWVEDGAPMPRESDKGTKVDAKSHWAYQPVKNHVGTIDTFIAAKLKEKGLSISAQADKRSLLRRVYFDLIGLPPTSAESDAFEQDASPQAYEKVVDRLLALPHYGERWARHWLDVARYADTKGYVFTEDRNFPYAYTYRDYVINAFNDDKPYDQFVVEQIAADKLERGNDNRSLAALGYLTLGRRFINNQHDIIDDRIDVVMRGFQGLTVGCARCHDHKFDPIPIGDYYSLYGVFASSKEPDELPLLNNQPRTKESEVYESELKHMEETAETFRRKMINDALARFRTASSIAKYLVTANELSGQPENKVAQTVQERKLQTTILERWRKLLTDTKGKEDPVFLAWHAFAATEARNYDSVRKGVLKNAKLHSVLKDALAESELKTIDDVAAVYGEVIAGAGRGKPTPTDETYLTVLRITTHYQEFIDSDEQFVPIPVKKQYREFRNAAQNYRATSPKAPPRAMVLVDVPKPVEPVIFLRGNPNNRGSAVPRQFLSVIAGPGRKPFTEGSGRLELARAIANADNPLTARVMVNRVWAWHFGQGLVRTPSDFGLQSDAPSHPELLDFLASRFVKDGWSLKKLHRNIVLSQTYRQSSAISEKAFAVDPENTLYSRSPRQRLDFEALRDSMLAASGTLDLSTIGGRSVDIFKAPFPTRRSVYTFIERQNLPGTLRMFDLASPDVHSPGRFRTTVPQQALFLMNGSFIAEMAKKTLLRSEIAAAQNDGQRIQAIYKAVYGRSPTPTEIDLAIGYVKTAIDAGNARLGPWAQLVQALFICNEFAFVD